MQVEYANEHCIYVTDQFARSKQVSQKQMFVSTISSRYFCLGYSSVDFVFRIVKGSSRIGLVQLLLCYVQVILEWEGGQKQGKN